MSADQLKLLLYNGEDFLGKSTCLTEHDKLNQEIINILDKYNKTSEEVIRIERLKKHVLKHQGEIK